MDTIQDCLFVGLGGALGAITRYLMGLIPLRHSSGFPIMTLVINVLGAFCVGFIVAFAGKNILNDPRLILFLKVGICGGFTTFSTFSLESSQLIQSGRMTAGVSYMLASVILCVAAVTCAQVVVK